MTVAILLVVIALASVLFHALSPWWLTPLASNWDQMDHTLIITLWISVIVFVAIIVFIAYAVIRFRYRPERRAAYEPENKKLEWWLIGLTSVGVVAMLVPGLYVWAKFVDIPKDALTFETVGQQWQWSFRFPGNDGKFGSVDATFISVENPFGLHSGNPFGQDDVLVQGSEVHLPRGRPVKVLLRAKDVLHDFYVPHFRVRMDAVPGMVTGLWFTPTRTGSFELACSEYCGVGHHTMRGLVVVEEEAAFQTWLKTQPTFAQSMNKVAMSKEAAGTGDGLAARGRELAQAQGLSRLPQRGRQPQRRSHLERPLRQDRNAGQRQYGRGRRRLSEEVHLRPERHDCERLLPGHAAVQLQRRGAGCADRLYERLVQMRRDPGEHSVMMKLRPTGHSSER